MITYTTVTRCFRSCPFFEAHMDGMACDHPKFDGKPYDGMIITHENSHDRVPDECPLKQHPVTQVVKLDLNIDGVGD